jgi:hypothetical protein
VDPAVKNEFLLSSFGYFLLDDVLPLSVGDIIFLLN